jgi:salicylate biosynthesis isochorismate synthase
MVLPNRLHVRIGDAAVEHRAVQIEPGAGAGDALARLLAPATGDGARRPEQRPSPAAEAEDGRDAAHLLRIRRALAAVRSGALEKVVVARDHVFRGPGAASPDAVFEALASRHPRCCSFLIRRGDAAFVGASPERLVRVARAEVRADALAGSAPRGATLDRDARLARDLLESKKEQEEHAVVVRALRDALEPLCSDLVVPEAPRVRALAGIQHLHTPVTGRLRPDVDLPLLALAERVHPTPAVAGAPRESALAWLGAHEELDRGWYAGGVGWMDLRGQGELFVALRSALLREGEARLFAGAGIVADSDARAELRETQLKLRAVLGALEACG